MKTNKEQVNNKSRNLEESLQNITNNSVSAQTDGFRYDYDDSTDIKNGKTD